MGNFKIGDTVRRVGTWGSPVGLPVGEVGIVSVLRGNDFVKIKGYGDWLHTTESLELVTQDDDELPPAPESVLYLKDDGQRKLTACMYPSSVGIKIHLEYPSTVKCLGYSMEPDAALQLAHDLNRMANEIKRRERNRT